MATVQVHGQVFVSLTDDLDGSEADETIMFALDGAGYEIDLNAKNAAALRKALDSTSPTHASPPDQQLAVVADPAHDEEEATQV